MSWSLDAGDPTIRKALQLAKANARTVQRMLLRGLLFYGKKVGKQEFFLRRVTTLSLYLFGILSVLAKIAADAKAGIRHPEELKLLDYFLEEAREARYHSTRISDTPKEKLGALIFQSEDAVK